MLHPISILLLAIWLAKKNFCKCSLVKSFTLLGKDFTKYSIRIAVVIRSIAGLCKLYRHHRHWVKLPFQTTFAANFKCIDEYVDNIHTRLAHADAETFLKTTSRASTPTIWLYGAVIVTSAWYIGLCTCNATSEESFTRLTCIHTYHQQVNNCKIKCMNDCWNFPVLIFSE